ncbi:hypothetical protein BDV29DRAFT_168070 [Aspergillus leporis]|uniref:Uncharacterized protein n=1 Tax=Aspergillus leporis TaxID=41062 RepID=A0A5N5X9Z0_9EURO|nr:hypothetical protein BDV29DRAFT_168070 [Aspergillus leporis]
MKHDFIMRTSTMTSSLGVSCVYTPSSGGTNTRLSQRLVLQQCCPMAINQWMSPDLLTRTTFSSPRAVSG